MSDITTTEPTMSEEKYRCRTCGKMFGRKVSTERNPSFQKIGRGNNQYSCLKCEEATCYEQRVDLTYMHKSEEPVLRNHNKIKKLRNAERMKKEKR